MRRPGWEQKKKIEDAERRKRDEETQRKNQQLIEEQQREEECRLFYQDCYQFHIARHNRPYFELYRDGLLFQAIYLDEEKRLNFLQIDGYAHAENNGCVPYDKIHYYEKAGSVHYTTDINGSFSSFGGSFTGASVSKAAGIAGGLLFGPMGMMAGALLTYKPAEMKMPETSAQITSEAHRIDERSVILNYYSDVKQQLIDIELPADCYNFLQTYLPEKRHSIVMELEKETIKNVQGIETERPQIPEQKAVQIGTDESMEEFENRVKKLKIMYDNGLLSEEEFLNEKKKLLNF